MRASRVTVVVRVCVCVSVYLPRIPKESADGWKVIDIKEKSLFIFHARIALKSLILLFVRLIARGARIGKTHTPNKYCNPRACAPRVNK